MLHGANFAGNVVFFQLRLNLLGRFERGAALRAIQDQDVLVQLAGIYSFLCLTLLQVLNQLIGFLLNLMVELRGREGNGVYCLVYQQKDRQVPGGGDSEKGGKGERMPP